MKTKLPILITLAVSAIVLTGCTMSATNTNGNTNANVNAAVNTNVASNTNTTVNTNAATNENTNVAETNTKTFHSQLGFSVSVPKDLDITPIDTSEKFSLQFNDPKFGPYVFFFVTPFSNGEHLSTMEWIAKYVTPKNPQNVKEDPSTTGVNSGVNFYMHSNLTEEDMTSSYVDYSDYTDKKNSQDDAIYGLSFGQDHNTFQNTGYSWDDVISKIYSSFEIN